MTVFKPATTTLVSAALFATLASVGTASAKQLTASEVKSTMLGSTIKTRRFGVPIRMFYKSNGTVKVTSPLGSVDGTWRARGNAFCTTFKEGPAKGTDCVTFTKTGANTYRTSGGTSFTVSR